MVDPITKIIGELGQGDVNTLESEVVAIEKGQKCGFLLVVLGNTKYVTVIDNPTVQQTSPENKEGYDKAIHPKDSSFVQSKEKACQIGHRVQKDNIPVTLEINMLNFRLGNCEFYFITFD